MRAPRPLARDQSLWNPIFCLRAKKDLHESEYHPPSSAENGRGGKYYGNGGEARAQSGERSTFQIFMEPGESQLPA